MKRIAKIGILVCWPFLIGCDNCEEREGKISKARELGAMVSMEMSELIVTKKDDLEIEWFFYRGTTSVIDSQSFQHNHHFEVMFKETSSVLLNRVETEEKIGKLFLPFLSRLRLELEFDETSSYGANPTLHFTVSGLFEEKE